MTKKAINPEEIPKATIKEIKECVRSAESAANDVAEMVKALKGLFTTAASGEAGAGYGTAAEGCRANMAIAGIDEILLVINDGITDLFRGTLDMLHDLDDSLEGGLERIETPSVDTEGRLNRLEAEVKRFEPAQA